MGRTVSVEEDMRPMKRVVIGMSGGVDSAVAALLLKRQGKEVIAVHMTNWDHEEEQTPACEGQEALDFASRNCKALEIPMYRVNFVQQYWNEVFQPVVLDNYASGISTPNPDVWCNRHIKFGSFISYVRNKFDPDYIATGHYARFVDHRLFRGADKAKDQSYFLSMVRKEDFQDVLFPLGDLTKEDVRDIARREGLPSAERRSSRGLCFVGKRDRFAEFLKQYIQPNPGLIVDMESGETVGNHEALWTMTIGQRANISGLSEAYYVVHKDSETNTIYVGHSDHPALYRTELTVTDINWFNVPSINDELSCRWNSQSQVLPCYIDHDTLSFNRARVTLPGESRRALAPGQVLVFYRGDECMGGGMIEAFPTPDIIAKFKNQESCL